MITFHFQDLKEENRPATFSISFNLSLVLSFKILQDAKILIYTHVVFPSSLNNIQLRVRRSERPICKVHSTMKFMIFPWKRLVPGTFLFTCVKKAKFNLFASFQSVFHKFEK